MITIDSLTVRYGQKTVLDRLTMDLTEGAVHGLAGINGAGKTTLFETLFGLVRPAAGSITRFGRPLRRSQIAYMPAESFFYDGMTGRDLLEMTAHYHPGTDPEPWIDLLGLPAEQPVGEWSAGMRRKLALAATLMQRKEVVLLDEPFNGLDMESLYVAQRLILRRRQEGATILITSHLLPTLTPIADDIRLLDDGRIAAEYRSGEYSRAERELEALLHARYTNLFPDKKIN